MNFVITLSKSLWIHEAIAEWIRRLNITQIKSTGEVPQRTSSHLATIVSRALQPQDSSIPCPVDRNLEFFLSSHIDFLFIFG